MALKISLIEYIIAPQEINIASLFDDYLKIHNTSIHRLK